MKFYVKKYGAAGGKDSTDAFERAAADAAAFAATGPGTKAAVVVEADQAPYMLFRPVRLADGVDLVGDGWNSQVVSYGWPAFVLGLPGVVGERPDACGVLDGSAAPNPGVRYGVKVGAGKFLQVQYHDLVVGRWQGIVDWQPGHDYWEKTDVLTVDVCVVRDPATPWVEYAPLVGIGQGSNSKPTPKPWFLSAGPQEFGSFRDTVVFAFADERWDGEYEWGGHGMLVSLEGPGPYHLAFQVNLRDGRLAAFQNGKQVPYLYWPANTGPKAFGPGHRFTKNEDWPLYVGVDGRGPGGGNPQVTPLSLYGLHVSSQERYKVGNPGDPQVSVITGRTPDDLLRYFVSAAADSTVAFLPLNDPGGGSSVNVADTRQVAAAALWMRGGTIGNKPATVRDLYAQSIGPTFALGAFYDLRFAGVRAESNESVAVGSWQVMSAYPLTMTDCYVRGGDSCVYGFRWQLWAVRTTVEKCGRDAFRLRGCMATLDVGFNKFVAPYCEYFFNVLPEIYAGQTLINDWLIDTEIPGVAFGTAVVACWAAPGNPTQLTAERVKVGITKRGDRPPVPLVRLYGCDLGGEFTTRPVAHISMCYSEPDCAATASCDHDVWQVRVNGQQMGKPEVLDIKTGTGGVSVLSDSATGDTVEGSVR